MNWTYEPFQIHTHTDDYGYENIYSKSNNDWVVGYTNIKLRQQHENVKNKFLV